MIDVIESPLLQHLRKKIEQEASTLEKQLGLGGYDHPAYLRTCGVLKGLRDALIYATEIDKKLGD